MENLPDILSLHIRYAQLKSYRNYYNLIGRPKVTPAQLTTLVLMRDNPGMSQVDLGAKLLMDRATTMALINKMEVKDWIKRHKSTLDKRKHALHLTKKGVALLKRKIELMDEIEKCFLKNLTKKEQTVLLKLLKKL